MCQGSKSHTFLTNYKQTNNNNNIPVEEEDMHDLARVLVLVLVDTQTSVLSCLGQSNEAALLRGSLGVVCSKKR